MIVLSQDIKLRKECDACDITSEDLYRDIGLMQIKMKKPGLNSTYSIFLCGLCRKTLADKILKDLRKG